MLKNIKWIFFDIGSTLSDESECYRIRFEEITRNTEITAREFEEKVIEFSRQNKKGDWAAAEYFGLPMPAWHKEVEKLYREAENVICVLSSKGYKIGIIANQSPGTAERLKKWGVLKYIEIILASAEEGVSKPDPEIFKRALCKADCLPENAVMIGDRLDNDIAPAKALGMKTIWIKQGYFKYVEQYTEDEKPDCTINNLSVLLELL
ncbi:MAG: HAD family hydrolase [Clostridia bacterium]|nr:HAD family hydrolase [Clostridia bacterium]